MVNITKFKEKHFPVLLDMHLAQHSKTYDFLDLDTLPKIGFIVYSDTEYHYVAAGFLRLVEGGFAQIDTLVTNPNLVGDVRNEGLTLLVDTLIKTAKDMELKGIYSMTTDSSIIDRAMKLGFFVSNHVVIVLDFK
jgi:hypothetical protein